MYLNENKNCDFKCEIKIKFLKEKITAFEFQALIEQINHALMAKYQVELLTPQFGLKIKDLENLYHCSPMAKGFYKYFVKKSIITNIYLLRNSQVLPPLSK